MRGCAVVILQPRILPHPASPEKRIIAVKPSLAPSEHRVSKIKTKMQSISLTHVNATPPYPPHLFLPQLMQGWPFVGVAAPRAGGGGAQLLLLCRKLLSRRGMRSSCLRRRRRCCVPAAPPLLQSAGGMDGEGRVLPSVGRARRSGMDGEGRVIARRSSSSCAGSWRPRAADTSLGVPGAATAISFFWKLEAAPG